MDVDDWLKSVEKKLQVVQCNNREKVQLTSGMLMWKLIRNLRASTGQSSEPLSMHIMFPGELSS
jgi:hypothetical protein